MKNNLKAQKGFTIVELLLYMGIFSILLTVLFQIFTSILSVQAESQATSSVDQDGIYIISRLSSDISDSTNVVVPLLGQASNLLHITGNGNDWTYSLSGGNLLLKNNITGTIDSLNSVNTSIDVNFTTIGESSAGSRSTVKINLTVTSRRIRDAGRLQVGKFETTIGTR